MSNFRLCLLAALLATSLLAPSMSLSAERAPGSTFQDCEGCPKMAVVPAGEFEMGSLVHKTKGNDDEGPVHRVKFAKPFAVGVNEVTRAEFARFAAESGFQTVHECQVVREERWQSIKDLDWQNPGFPQEASHPVVCLSWRDASQYAAWLARVTGKPYRLLSESEWEYLAKKGSGGHPLDHEVANYGGGDPERCCAGKAQGRDSWEFTAPVGSFPADAFGLHDVLGNVWEWLGDCYFASYEGAPTDGRARTAPCIGKRSVRGGSYGDGAELLRSDYRLRGPEEARYATLGFRVARDLD